MVVLSVRVNMPVPMTADDGFGITEIGFTGPGSPQDMSIQASKPAGRRNMFFIITLYLEN
jgi:hypothetical protein